MATYIYIFIPQLFHVCSSSSSSTIVDSKSNTKIHISRVIVLEKVVDAKAKVLY